tara:strand:+ start:143 stop:391 length:249 start_codon:yes stop_codon:yes gene_type:complete
MISDERLLNLKDLEEEARLLEISRMVLEDAQHVAVDPYGDMLLPEDKCNLCCPDHSKDEWKFEVTERIYCDDEVVNWIKRAD